jgi:hypothetical protein
MDLDPIKSVNTSDEKTPNSSLDNSVNSNGGKALTYQERKRLEAKRKAKSIPKKNPMVPANNPNPLKDLEVLKEGLEAKIEKELAQADAEIRTLGSKESGGLRNLESKLQKEFNATPVKAPTRRSGLEAQIEAELEDQATFVFDQPQNVDYDPEILSQPKNAMKKSVRAAKTGLDAQIERELADQDTFVFNNADLVAADQPKIELPSAKDQKHRSSAKNDSSTNYGLEAQIAAQLEGSSSEDETTGPKSNIKKSKTGLVGLEAQIQREFDQSPEVEMSETKYSKQREQLEKKIENELMQQEANNLLRRNGNGESSEFTGFEAQIARELAEQDNIGMRPNPKHSHIMRSEMAQDRHGGFQGLESRINQEFGRDFNGQQGEDGQYTGLEAMINADI